MMKKWIKIGHLKILILKRINYIKSPALYLSVYIKFIGRQQPVTRRLQSMRVVTQNFQRSKSLFKVGVACSKLEFKFGSFKDHKFLCRDVGPGDKSGQELFRVTREYKNCEFLFTKPQNSRWRLFVSKQDDAISSTLHS